MFYIKTTLLALIVSVAAMAQKSITQQVYWIDNDIGAAKAMVTGTTLDLSAFAPGVHVLTMQVQDSEGLWSSPETRIFIVPHATVEATSIVEREYWIDNKIATRATLDESPATISLLDLTPGVHVLTVRVKDDAGLWSVPDTKFFIVPTKGEQEGLSIARYMYWFDNDTTNLISGTLTEPAAMLPITITNLEEGDHTVTWRVADNKGVWSECVTDSFTFTKTLITSAMITLAASTFEYSAEDIEPEVIVTDSDITLIAGEDYDITYNDNRNAGQATVTVIGKGAYKESDFTTFTIAKAPLTVTADNKSRHQDDEESPPLTITYSGWKGADNEGVLLALPVASCIVQPDSPVGEYPIIVSGGEALNYEFIYVNGVFTVSEPTAIHGVENNGQPAKDNSKCLDLYGRPVDWQTAPKGIYILNGRKVLKR